jgi:hypothetical protein
VKQCPKCKTRHPDHARYCMYDGVMLEGSPGGFSLADKLRSTGWFTRALLVLVLLLLGSDNLERAKEYINHRNDPAVNPSQSIAERPTLKDIYFTIENVETFGSSGVEWVECRIIVDTNFLPFRELLKEIALEAWRAEGVGFQEIDIEFYMIGMSTSGTPYAEAIVKSDGVYSLHVFPRALRGTNWEGEKVPGS